MIPIKDNIQMYIRFIYLMPWKFVCYHWVSWSFYKTVAKSDTWTPSIRLRQRAVYVLSHTHTLYTTYTYTYNNTQLQPTQTHIRTYRTHTHTFTSTRKDSYTIPTVFDFIFRLSIHFILLSVWWLLFRKNFMKPRSRRQTFMALNI